MAKESDESDDELKIKPKYMKYDVESSKLDSSGLYYKDSDSELEMESDSESEQEKETLGMNLVSMLYSLLNWIVLNSY